MSFIVTLCPSGMKGHSMTSKPPQTCNSNAASADKKKSKRRKPPKPDADCYTIEQVAAKRSCSTKTIRRRIKQKKLRATKDGGILRISHADYLAYVDKLKRPPDPS